MQTLNMTKKISKSKRSKEFILSIFSIIIILSTKNLYENGILREIFLRALKAQLSLISMRQRQDVGVRQELCELKNSVVFYQVPDLSSQDREVLFCPYFQFQFNVFRTLLETGESLGFLLETSNRSSLTVRQGCAVESCVRQSARFCLLLVESARLNVCDRKVSELFSLPNILVFHLNVSLLTHSTPLEKMFKDGRVATSCCRTIHYSDILRLAVLYR